MSKWIDDVSLGSVKRTSYVAHSGEAEFANAKESDSGGRTVRIRLIRPPEDAGKAHPFAKYTRQRRGKGGSRFEIAFNEINGTHEVMAEFVLLNWTSNPRGDFVDLLVNSEDNSHPFMVCRRPTKDVAGTRWMIVALEKDDDEAIVKQDQRDRLEDQRRTGKVQHLSNVARLMTKNERFWEWLTETVVSCTSTAEADEILKELCEISSKSELDSVGPEGVKKIAAFHRMRERFLEWQERMGFEIEE